MSETRPADKLGGTRLELAAITIVETAFDTDAVVARRYGVGERSIQRWRRQAAEDPTFGALVEQTRREFKAAWALDLRRRVEPGFAAEPSLVLSRAVAASVSSVAAYCGLLPVLAVAKLRQLPSGRRPDLLLSHGAAGYTACLVLPWADGAQSELEHRTLGRLVHMLEDARLVSPEEERLDYLEGLRLLCRIARVSVRAVVLADYELAPIFRRAVERVGGECFDLSACLRSQNVLTSEVAPAAGAPSP
jgi:transposase-like protein